MEPSSDILRAYHRCFFLFFFASAVLFFASAVLFFAAAFAFAAIPSASPRSVSWARASPPATQQDVAATLSCDLKALADVLTDDDVLLEPDAPAIVGKDAILSANQKDKAEHPSSKVLSYKPEIHDLQVSAARLPNGLIFEASYKESENGLPKTLHAKALRVLRREPNGEWKFSRLMWNSAS